MPLLGLMASLLSFSRSLFPYHALTLIYNQLLSVAEVPADRKKAFVVPVFKKDPTASVVNYRPISLTSRPILSKILERILVAKIIDHLHANGLVSPEQHGSTCTNLISLTHKMIGLSILSWVSRLQSCTVSKALAKSTYSVR